MRVAFDEERLEHGHVARGDRTHRSEVEDLQLTVYAQLTISVVWVENKGMAKTIFKSEIFTCTDSGLRSIRKKVLPSNSGYIQHCIKCGSKTRR